MDLSQQVADFLLAADGLRDAALRINPLTLDQCVAETRKFREIPICAELGLVVLDDANDSNPFCLVTRGPAADMVVHFCHDPEPRLRFPCLPRFLAALRSIHERRLEIHELPHEPLGALDNQPALVDYLCQLFSGEHEDAATLVALHFPLLHPSQTTVVYEAAQHDNFFMREAAAHFVRLNPSDAYLDAATALARDRYSQVANPARKALGSIRRLIYERRTP